MKPPRRRNGQISPVALLLLFALVSLPFVAWLWPDRHAGPTAAGGPRHELIWDVPAGSADAPPTRGMTIGEDGFASVTDAPQLLAVETWGSGTIGFVPDSMATRDVARFLRALPRERLVGAHGDRVTTCTLEGEARYEGRIVLEKGCLRLQHAGAPRPGPIVLGYFGVFRDDEGYLAVGATDGRPEGALRVGEPEAVLGGVGCSNDAPVPAPPELARICGADTLVRLGTIRRLAICSQERVELLERRARDYRIIDDRMRRERAACIASGRSGTTCPPGAAPMPPTDTWGCRMPDGATDRIERALRPSS